MSTPWSAAYRPAWRHSCSASSLAACPTVGEHVPKGVGAPLDVSGPPPWYVDDGGEDLIWRMTATRITSPLDFATTAADVDVGDLKSESNDAELQRIMNALPNFTTADAAHDPELELHEHAT
jgi:hypothetical protein